MEHISHKNIVEKHLNPYGVHLNFIKSHCAPMRPGIGNGVSLIAPSCALDDTSTSGHDCLAHIYRVA